MVPILSEILFGADAGAKRFQLAAIYAPYFVFPLLLVLRMSLASQPFKPAAKAGKAKRG